MRTRAILRAWSAHPTRWLAIMKINAVFLMALLQFSAVVISHQPAMHSTAAGTFRNPLCLERLEPHRQCLVTLLRTQ